jgi:hypothetical protein
MEISPGIGMLPPPTRATSVTVGLLGGKDTFEFTETFQPDKKKIRL